MKIRNFLLVTLIIISMFNICYGEVSNYPSLKDIYSKEELLKLREITAEEYGESLVSTNHKGLSSPEEHEKAQYKAYEDLQGKIDKGLVKPDSIQSDMIDRLNLRGKAEVKINKFNQIDGEIAKELDYFTEKGFITLEEEAQIQLEIWTFTHIYIEGFPKAGPQQVFILLRDNARKLAYETERDKHFFAGSDHGTRHIIEGNIRIAIRILDGLGDKATVKDSILIHQITIDHDLGYTLGAAQAKNAIAAISDHPLFSTRFIEDNKDYYIKNFGYEEYNTIKEGVLLHSYPETNYNTPTDPNKGFNPYIVRSVTSTADALGITSETKCPAFFRNAESMKVLLKAGLFAETHDGKISQEMVEKYKAELMEIAGKEVSKERRNAYYDAINLTEKSFSYIVENILSQYIGIVADVTMKENKDGKILPQIELGMSQLQPLIILIFGNNTGTKAFLKVMDDFGVSKNDMNDMSKLMSQVMYTKPYRDKQYLMSKLNCESDIAAFHIGYVFNEVDPEIWKVFEELHEITVREEIRNLSEGIKTNPQSVTLLMEQVISAINKKGAPEDLMEFQKIRKEIEDNINNPRELEKVMKKLNTFTTGKERAYISL